jgi:hypothetical protein
MDDARGMVMRTHDNHTHPATKIHLQSTSRRLLYNVAEFIQDVWACHTEPNSDVHGMTLCFDDTSVAVRDIEKELYFIGPHVGNMRFCFTWKRHRGRTVW